MPGMATPSGPLDYTTNYKNALSQNQALYGNIVQGYQNTRAQQQSASDAIAKGYTGLGNQINSALQPMRDAAQGAINQQQNITAGYGQLSSDVLGGIQGIDASQRQAIQDAYAQQTGATNQSMISRGLGNTTVRDSVLRGNMLDKQKADIALSNQTAQLQAGYRSQLGLAGLNYQGQAVAQNLGQANTIANAQAGYGSQIGLAGLGYANQANQQGTALNEDQLHFMNTVSMPYPNSQQYNQLAQQAGAAGAGAPRAAAPQTNVNQQRLAAAQGRHGGPTQDELAAIAAQRDGRVLWDADQNKYVTTDPSLMGKGQAFSGYNDAGRMIYQTYDDYGGPGAFDASYGDAPAGYYE